MHGTRRIRNEPMRATGPLTLLVAVTLSLTTAACSDSDSPTAPRAEDVSTAETSSSLIPAARGPRGFAPGGPPRAATEALGSSGIFPHPTGSGHVTLRKNPNGTFSWLLKARGLERGNAVTVWVGNFSRDLDGAGPGTLEDDGGRGFGGLVGGSGRLTAAGNHCVHALEQTGTGLIGGFQPGVPPDCGLVDPSLPIWFFLVDHGPWTGEVADFWSPLGTDPATFVGVLEACVGSDCPAGF